MDLSWCNGWREISDEKHRLYIERELQWELDQVSEHPLHGILFRVVGGCNLYNDFIVRLEDERSYGYVHLVWTAAAPMFKRLGNPEALHQFIREWKEQS